MRGVNLDKKSGLTNKDEEFAEKMRKRRSMAAKEKQKYDKEEAKKLKVISYKGESTELYTEEDKARLARGLKPDPDADGDETSS